MNEPMVNHALEYLEKHKLSVIPMLYTPPVPPETKGKKKPYIKWTDYQDKFPTVDEIKAWWHKWPKAMIGVVTGKLSGIVSIDVDEQIGFDEINKLIPDSLIIPTYKTPSGGVQMIFAMPSFDLRVAVRNLPGCDLRAEGGIAILPPSFNQAGKYEWMPGLSMNGSSLPALPSAYINKINTNYIYKGVVDKQKEDSLQTSTCSTNVYTEGTRDQDLFHIAHLLVKAGCGENYLIKTMEILATNCVPPFPLDEARAKIKSALERANRKERNLSGDVRDYILSTNGVFLSTDIAKCLHLSTREDLKNLSIILKRLNVNDHLIEKYGNRNGTWRVVDTEEELIDIFNADLAPYDIKLPLRIQEYVTIHKGNVIIIAGESNAGKTSFCLNVARMNRGSNFINYLSSEMQNGAELRIRLDEFGEAIEKWKPVKFQFRTDDFPDKIMPDALNIIDYLDEGNDEEAHKMPSRIRNISNKLRSGVAVIAIQKDPNKQFGYGGSGTLNRARLYLTVTRQGVMTVVKGKIWRNKNINPNGMYCNYKLAAGCKYSIDGDWKW